MFISQTTTRRTANKTYRSVRLVESRRVGRKVQQKTLLNLGAHFAIPKAQWAELVEIIEARLAGNEFLFEPAPELTATAELDFVQKSLKSTPKKIPLAATSSRACSRRKMIPRKSPIPCHRFRWNLDHPQTRHTKIYNNQLFNYPIYLPNSAGPKIRATVQPHFLNLTLCIE